MIGIPNNGGRASSPSLPPKPHEPAAPAPSPTHAFFSSYATTEVTLHHRLPHWEQTRVLYFVSWHLADSLPQAKLRNLQDEKKVWLANHPQPWNPQTENEYHERFTHAIDRWLDAGEGSCPLKKPEQSKVVADALHHFHETRYTLESFVVMPNHVHVLFAPLSPHKLEGIIHSWKSFTAHKLNPKQGGSFWQEGYWDRIVRNEKHLQATLDYIRQNPTKAHLSENEFHLYCKESDANGGRASSPPPPSEEHGLEARAPFQNL